MNWTLKTISQEAEHRFLNFYTFTYQVKKEGTEQDYPYFVASRHGKDALLAKTKDYDRPDGVLIMVVKEGPEPSVLLIKQFRPPLNGWVIEFPAGLLEPTDKNEVEAAKRESVEEAGVELKDVTLLCPSSPTSSGLSDEMVAVVEGKVAGITATHLEKFEDIQARFVPLEDIPAILEDKNLIIALNVRLALLYLLERHKEGN